MQYVLQILAGALFVDGQRPARAMIPNSGEAYASAAKAKGFPVQTIALGDGTKAHSIGEPMMKKVLLYLHGMS